MNNLEWLYEHDREAMFDMVACGDKNCCECGIAKYYPDCDLDENGTRREWLLSEHVDDESCRQDADQPKRQESPDCESDSREKLKSDAYRLMCDTWNKGLVFAKHPYEDIPLDAVMWKFGDMLNLLNRQAEITEREIEKKWSSFSDSVDGHIAKLQSGHDRTVTALERANAEIAELQDQLESAHAKNRALKAHIAKMQEGRHGWHIKGKELQQQVDCLMAERDRYRELCGKLLDAADDMHLLRSLYEGKPER